MNDRWGATDAPRLDNRPAVVTGANTGLGFETASVLAARGASVVLTVRDVDKGKQAANRITAAPPGAGASVRRLDLSSLISVRAAADELTARYPRIDLLIENAGVMFAPKQTTRDGFEPQFGTNHLGHLALTGLLLERMLPVPGSRVETVTVAAHPGFASTGLLRNSPPLCARSPPPTWTICWPGSTGTLPITQKNPPSRWQRDQPPKDFPDECTVMRWHCRLLSIQPRTRLPHESVNWGTGSCWWRGRATGRLNRGVRPGRVPYDGRC